MVVIIDCMLFHRFQKMSFFDALKLYLFQKDENVLDFMMNCCEKVTDGNKYKVKCKDGSYFFLQRVSENEYVILGQEIIKITVKKEAFKSTYP